MSEYDLQFQADLEKAQALSLESLALEQFRRQKQLSSAGNWRNIVYSRTDRMIQDLFSTPILVVHYNCYLTPVL